MALYTVGKQMPKYNIID